MTPKEKQIISAFPAFSFKKGKKYAYHPPKTVVIGPSEPHSELLLLHEISHALLDHKAFKTDVERLKIESAAWDKAKNLAKGLNIPFDSDFAETCLDSYRDWLHKKSLCKSCNITMYQTPDGTYHCPTCGRTKSPKKQNSKI